MGSEMIKSAFALLTMLIASLVLAGSATTASAHYRHYGHHGCCGPGPPSYVYKSVPKIRPITRYHDVARTNFFYRPHRIVHVTRVQPIVYVHTVTRVHHHLVGIVRPVYQHVTEYLPPRR